LNAKERIVDFLKICYELCIEYMERILLLAGMLILLYFGHDYAAREYRDAATRLAEQLDSKEISAQTGQFLMSNLSNNLLINLSSIIGLLLIFCVLLIVIHMSSIKKDIREVDLRLWDMERTIRQTRFPHLNDSFQQTANVDELIAREISLDEQLSRQMTVSGLEKTRGEQNDGQ
jgi:hypothetical protein